MGPWPHSKVNSISGMELTLIDPKPFALVYIEHIDIRRSEDSIQWL